MEYTKDRISEIKKEIDNTEHLSGIWSGQDFESIDFDKFNNGEEVYDYIFSRVYEHEVIYYINAIEFLKEYDTSLYESLTIASELGYEIENINSEVLATLLVRNLACDELDNINFDNK